MVSSAQERPVSRSAFNTTHWTVVLQAGDSRAPERDRALEELCRTYWFPLYAFVRRQGRGPDDARDLTQGFFAHLLGNAQLRLVAPEKGRFRTFLLTALSHFLANQWIKDRRLKRGGGQWILSLDDDKAEARFLAEPADFETPERAYERRWALAVLQRAIERLEVEFMASGRRAFFAATRFALSGDRADESYREIAERLGTSEGALKVGILRMRRRFGELLRAEVASTVSSPEEVEAELRHLLTVLRP